LSERIVDTPAMALLTTRTDPNGGVVRSVPQLNSGLISNSTGPDGQSTLSMLLHNRSEGCEMRKFVVHGWNFIFNHNVSPLRHIEDVAIRHYILQALGFMWAVSFSIAIGSYTTAFANIIGHAVLIGAAAVTVATYSAAKINTSVFKVSGRRRDGEHE
jgi:hypothetical protein